MVHKVDYDNSWIFLRTMNRFLQGGASLQFYMLPLNLLTPERKVAPTSPLVPGRLRPSRSRSMCRGHTSWKPDSTVFNRVPSDAELEQEAEAVYTHYTSNNTIFGTQFHRIPASSGHIVSDLSSDICSRPIDISAHDVIYAGAQKNLGPSGVTAVILSPWAVDKAAMWPVLEPVGCHQCSATV